MNTFFALVRPTFLPSFNPEERLLTPLLHKQYPGEISPTNIRAFGVGTNYAVFNAVVIALVQVTPIAIDAISWRYFLIFVICDAIFIVIFYFFFPETKNKTLEEIEAIFGDKVCSVSH